MATVAHMPRVGIVGARGPVAPESGEYIPIENPATGQVWAEAFESSAGHVDEVVTTAAQVFRETWRDMAPDERGRLVRRWAELIAERRDELADLETDDVGHLRREALGDVDGGARWLTYYAGMADKIEGRSFAQYPDRVAYQSREPYGVVAGVNPFNGNPMMFGWKAGPALIAGNCFVLKAPEVAPLSSFRMAELALEAGIPPGVVNVVTGRGEITGRALSEHPEIGMLVFTGSPEASRAVIAQSAATITPLSLELGGKSAVILLEDADLDTAIPSILHSNFVKSGQSCAAGSRIFVPDTLYDEAVGRIESLARSIRVGPPRDPASQMGALISHRQLERVDSIVTSAVGQGATRLAGGCRADERALGEGYFYRPTVLIDVTDDNIVASTEVFGPVASVLRYSDIDEVLARANGARMGLTAQIWGNDARAIQYLARRLEAGTVWVNTYRAIHPTIPFGGMKESGYGRENGFDAIDLYTRSKAVVWDLNEERTLPYGAR